MRASIIFKIIFLVLPSLTLAGTHTDLTYNKEGLVATATIVHDDLPQSNGPSAPAAGAAARRNLRQASRQSIAERALNKYKRLSPSSHPASPTCVSGGSAPPPGGTLVGSLITGVNNIQFPSVGSQCHPLKAFKPVERGTTDAL
jgi:hypothetical protein